MVTIKAVEQGKLTQRQTFFFCLSLCLLLPRRDLHI